MNRRKNFVLLLALLASVQCLRAEDVVQVAPFTTTAGVSLDDEETFSMEMVNTNAYTALEFRLFLPEGMTLDLDYPFEMNQDRFPGVIKKKVFYPDHDYDITNPTPGQYYVKIYNTDLKTIDGTEGEILSFYYATSADMKPGIYPIRVTGTVLAVDSHNGVEPAPSVSFVKVTDADGNVPANALLDLGTDMIPSFVESELPDKNVIINGVCNNFVLTDGADFNASSAFTATQASFNTSVNAYKTLTLPFDAAVPEGFTAMNAISVTGTSVNLEEVSSVSAGKPVLIQGTGELMLTASDATVAATAEADLVNGMLCGTYKGTPSIVGSYVLQKQNGVVGFYQVRDIHPTVGAFRAWLNVPNADVKAFFFNTEDATSINEDLGMTNEESGDAIYNLLGQRIEKARQGVCIVNGKKIVVK